MKAVILAAGASSRFYPFSPDLPKFMIPLLGKPILAQTIASLAKVGIQDIVLVVGKDLLVKDYFAQGEKFGVKITYITQEKPLGMGDALLRAAHLLKENFFLLHAHHLDVDEFVGAMLEGRQGQAGVLLGQVREQPWEYGVLKLAGDRVLGLVEKPKKGSEPGKVCLVGIYLLSQSFLPVLAKTKPSHYQFEDALDKFAKQEKLKVEVTQKKTISLKYPWDLLALKNYLLEKSPHRISRGAKIGKGVILVGKMIIEDGVTIFENAVIKGPVYLGKNVLVGNNALVRNSTSLEENSRVGAFAEVKGSLFLPGSSLASGFCASSIIGENAQVAHGFVSANRRFDRKTIKVKIAGKGIETGLDDLGVIMGQGVKVGIGVGTMPGITMGKGAIVGPGTLVFEDIPPGTHYYTQFKNIVKK